MEDVGAPKLIADSLAAYRNGDRQALVDADDALRGLYPAPTVFPIPCSPEDLRQRRGAGFAAVLTALRDAPAGLDEAGRYVRLQRLLMGSVGGQDLYPPGGGGTAAVDSAAPNDSTCRKGALTAVLLAFDGDLRERVLRSQVTSLSDWRDALDRRLGHDQAQALLDAQGAGGAAVHIPRGRE